MKTTKKKTSKASNGFTDVTPKGTTFWDFHKEKTLTATYKGESEERESKKFKNKETVFTLYRETGEQVMVNGTWMIKKAIETNGKGTYQIQFLGSERIGKGKNSKQTVNNFKILFKK